MTNLTFTKEDKTFIEACKEINLPATKRQASKWRNKKGLAWRTYIGDFAKYFKPTKLNYN